MNEYIAHSSSTTTASCIGRQFTKSLQVNGVWKCALDELRQLIEVGYEAAVA